MSAEVRVAMPTGATTDAAPPGEAQIRASLRRFPYPYRAMLAICSDLDETPDARTYERIMTYLNSERDPGWGRGVGLEVGNTLYFDMPPGQFAYGNTDEAGRAMARDLMRSGHIDSLHSFGDLATTRDHAARALDELERHGLRLEVWIDHARAVTNFGADIMHGQGDVPGSPAYHADLTCRHGVQYVWRGRVTSVIGQDRPASLGGVWDAAHPLASTKTCAKEYAKHRLGRRGHAKYGMHGANDLVRRATLRDGQRAWEFIRCNPFWGGVENSDTAAGMANVLTRRFLDRLIEREGIGILYTHLGKTACAHEPFPAPTRAAFERLAEYAGSGKILVTTTRRLLGYRQARELARIRLIREGCGCTMKLDAGPDAPNLAPTDWQGLTLYLDDADPALRSLSWEYLTPGRAHASPLQVNAPDQTGRMSVSIPWPRLEYPLA